MRLLYKLKDNEFKYNGITKTRKAIRGIVINKENKIAIIHLFGDDIFGHRDYYETPGGGKKRFETNKKALKREIKEELGVTIKNIKAIGKIIDYYNLINQKNISYYYLCYVDRCSVANLTGFEKKIFENIYWYDIDTIISLYSNMINEPLARLVKNREEGIFKLVKIKWFDKRP